MKCHLHADTHHALAGVPIRSIAHLSLPFALSVDEVDSFYNSQNPWPSHCDEPCDQVDGVLLYLMDLIPRKRRIELLQQSLMEEMEGGAA